MIDHAYAIVVLLVVLLLNGGYLFRILQTAIMIAEHLTRDVPFVASSLVAGVRWAETGIRRQTRLLL